MQPLAPDTTGGDGSHSLRAPRDLESFGPDDFNAANGGRSAMQPLARDTSAGHGVERMPRDYGDFGPDGWKRGDGATTLIGLGPDATPSSGSHALRAPRDVDSYGAHDFSAAFGGRSALQPLGPDTTAGCGVERMPRDYASFGRHDFKPGSGPTTMLPLRPDASAGTGHERMPRDYVDFGPDGWVSGKGPTTMFPLGPDGYGGDGRECMPRDFDSYGGRDFHQGGGPSRMRPLAPNASAGDGRERMHRDFESFGDEDWRRGDGVSTMHALAPDTAAGDGRERMHRSFDSFGGDDWKRGTGASTLLPLVPDTSAGDGTERMPRDIDSYGAQGWKSTDGATTLVGLSPDASAGNGRERMPRDIESYGEDDFTAATGGRSAMRPLGPETSAGSGRERMPRDIEIYGKGDFNAASGGRSAMQALAPDATGGDGTERMPRDFSGNEVWSSKNGAIQPLAPHGAPSQGSVVRHAFRDEAAGTWVGGQFIPNDDTIYDTDRKFNQSDGGHGYEEEWRMGGSSLTDDYAALRATDSLGAAAVATTNFRPSERFGAEDDWRVAIQYEDAIHKAWMPPMAQPSPRPEAEPKLEKPMAQDPGAWVNVAPAPLATVNNPSFAKNFVVEPVLTTEEVRSFKFRDLDKMHTSKDWKPAAGKATKNGLFGMPDRLERDPYVDPARRLSPLRNGKMVRNTAGYKAAVIQKLISPCKTTAVMPNAPSKPLGRPSRNFTTKGRIGDALRKHDEERVTKKVLAGGANTLVQSREYNELLRSFLEHRKLFVAAENLLDAAIQEREAAIAQLAEEETDGVVLEPAAPVRRTKTVMTAKRIAKSNKYFAKKTGAVRMSEYKDLQDAMATLIKAVGDYRKERASTIAYRSRILYAVHGFKPHVCIVPVGTDRRIGIQIQKNVSSVGFSISHIGEAAHAATEMHTGDLIIELNGTFVLDSSYEEIRAAFAQTGAEATFVLVRADELRRLGESAAEEDAGDAQPAMPVEDCTATSAASNAEPSRVRPSDEDASTAPYAWQSGLNSWQTMEKRREALLCDTHLTSDAALMEEWLELLQARREHPDRKGSPDLAAMQQLLQESPPSSPPPPATALASCQRSAHGQSARDHPDAKKAASPSSPLSAKKATWPSSPSKWFGATLKTMFK